MQLADLLQNLEIDVKNFHDVEVMGITANSKLVKPQWLFVAKKGVAHDGNQFAAEVVQAGASVILSSIDNPALEGVVQLIHPDVEKIEEILVNRFYGHPAEKLFLVGITGTNGKTTTAFLVHHLLNPCGMIGTVKWIIGDKVLPATHTTPDFITLTKLLHDMAANECKSAVMEVSSHALEQGRVKGIPFDVAVFTNLTQDHLDYHKTMEAYAAAKKKLFTSLEGMAIINADDPWHWMMVEHCKSPILTYGFSGKLSAAELKLHPQGIEFTVHFEGETAICRSQLIGRFNVYNLLAATAVGLTFGLTLEETLRRLESFERVPGRLERVPNVKNLNIFVDYAHTDDALKNVLETLQEVKTGRLITVFGCGGNRDAGKRPKMAAVAEALSDIVIVTTDNPRNEDPHAIITQITSGFQKKDRALIHADREEAIRAAIRMATPQDIILIAGKGHETVQIFKDRTLPFDDREVARQACSMLDSATCLP
jgi:UDP-N-acetylmuramoyl-L-alanyl-D-glutamate--2,6-diaminopimelate ligase